jgi:DNA-binding transcriptional MocR family regulator
VGKSDIEVELRQLAASSPAGTRLPSVRALSSRHRASPVTVQRVLDGLTREGLVEPHPGVGTFVAAHRRATVGDRAWQDGALSLSRASGTELDDLLGSEPLGVIPMATGYAEIALQPTDLIARATQSCTGRPSTWDRMPFGGLPELRHWFSVDIGAGFAAEDITITSGGQAALSLILRTVVPPGGVVVTENPTYQGVLEVARLAGVRVVGVTSDAHGIRPDVLEDTLRSTGARLVVLQPRLANPTGATLALDRRDVVLEAVRRARAFVVEDDFARDLEWSQVPTPMLAVHDVDGHVIVIRSLTKTTAPGLRVAGLAARGPIRARLRSALAIEEFFVSGLLQYTALGVVEHPRWPRHIRNLRSVMQARLTTLTSEMALQVPDLELMVQPHGGFFAWYGLPEGADEAAFVLSAREAGVALSAGRRWFPNDPDRAYVRVSVARADESSIVDAVHRLARVPADRAH